MANYAYVENNKILEYYDNLPNVWRNISGFNLLINDENHLKSLGWHKIIKNQVNYNPDNQKISGYEYYFENNNVYGNPIIENYIPDQQNIVPSQISATQLRLWLVKNNISLSSINTTIESLEDELLKKELLVRWEYAPYFERSNSFIDQIGNMLGLNSEQIDQAFIEASQYE